MLLLLVAMQVRLQVYNYTAHIYIGVGISIMVIPMQQLYTRIYPRPNSIVTAILSNGCHYILLTAVVGRKINAFFTSSLDKRRKKSRECNKYETPMCVARHVYFLNERHFIYRMYSYIVYQKFF